MLLKSYKNFHQNMLEIQLILTNNIEKFVISKGFECKKSFQTLIALFVKSKTNYILLKINKKIFWSFIIFKTRRWPSNQCSQPVLYISEQRFSSFSWSDKIFSFNSEGTHLKRSLLLLEGLYACQQRIGIRRFRGFHEVMYAVSSLWHIIGFYNLSSYFFVTCKPQEKKT